MIKTKFSTILLLFLLMSCSTKYGPKTLMGGYESIDFGNDTYSVSFLSNQTMSSDENYLNCLYRCSEIAIMNNKTSFQVLKESDEGSQLATGNIYSSGTVQANTIRHPKTVLRIKLTNSCSGNVNCFNAHEFIKNNSSKISPSRKLKKERGRNWKLIK